jgi:hypothetical protein
MSEKERMTKSCSLTLKSGIRAGYRPIHGWVYPDQMKQWMTGWFDLDSTGAMLSGGEGATESAPPPPPG